MPQIARIRLREWMDQSFSSTSRIAIAFFGHGGNGDGGGGVTKELLPEAKCENSPVQNFIFRNSSDILLISISLIVY